MEQTFPFDVFLSHSSKDKAVVRQIAERLREDGLKVWFDEWVLKPGDHIQAKIEDGLERSRVLVLCMSAHALGSDWAQLEAGTFRFRDPLNKERRFIPLRLDDTPIMGSLKQFKDIDWGPSNQGQSYAELVDFCRGRHVSSKSQSQRLQDDVQSQTKTKAQKVLSVQADETILFVDLKGIIGSGIKSPSKVSELVSLPQDVTLARSSNDIYVAAFASASDAVCWALQVRDAFHNFDWLAAGGKKVPTMRALIAAGRGKKTEAQIGKLIPRLLGNEDPTLSQQEPSVNCGEVWVTSEVVNRTNVTQHSKIWFKMIDQRERLSNEESLFQFKAYWKGEQNWVTAQITQPLADEQAAARVFAMRKFSLLWLLLDQLPRGSWGRSTAPWMNQVWGDIPSMAPNPLIEDEGGFETTILNVGLLFQIFGERFYTSKVYANALHYLQERNDHRGFGPIGQERQGMKIQPHPRHTALAGWLLGSIATTPAFADAAIKEMFCTACSVLFGSDTDSKMNSFYNDRHPLLLYMAALHVHHLLNSPESQTLFSGEDLNQMNRRWKQVEKILQKEAWKDVYSQSTPGPSHLAKGRPTIYPLTLPYGGFVRMESYSVLSAALLYRKWMPLELAARLTSAIAHIAQTYDRDFGEPDRRYSRDPLRPLKTDGEGCAKQRGVRPHFSETETIVDLGATALLYSTLRSVELREHLTKAFESRGLNLGKLRSFLHEDLAHQFDRYLVSPELFSLSHPGMLAWVLAGDDPIALLDLGRQFGELLDQPLTNIDLSDNTLESVISERRLEELVEQYVASDDSLSPSELQVATASLVRLLVDRIRPGQYAKEDLSRLAASKISMNTCAVYADEAFVEKYDTVWRNSNDDAILKPFLGLLPPEAHILDVGCGPGHYAIEFAKAGHHVQLLDSSEAALELATKRISDAGFNVSCLNCDIADVNRLEASIPSDKLYDAIWCSGTLVHIPKLIWHELLSWFRRHLRPSKGLLFVNIMLRNACLFSKDGRYFTYLPSASEFDQMLGRSGLEVSHVLRKKVKRNTYGEPLLETEWANFYAYSSTSGPRNLASVASTMTQFAYKRSFRIFAERHSAQSNRSAYFKQQIDKLLENIRSSSSVTVLDVGCGSGDLVKLLVERGCEVVGVDISEEMVVLSRKTTEACDPKPIVELHDMCSLPTEWSRRFDGIICITALQHIPIWNDRLQVALKEFARVLKPGGVARVDIRLALDGGWDPDLRYIQTFESATAFLPYLEAAGFGLIQEPELRSLGKGINTFQRAVEINFAELWVRRKIGND